MRLGTSLVLELMASGRIKPLDDPWLVLDAILRGREKPPQSAYVADIKAVAKTWEGLNPTRRGLLRLLSRFSLSPQQMNRWFDASRRAKAVRTTVDDEAILKNPYRIAEQDLGDADDYPISVATIDRGMLPDATVAAAHPVEEPSHVGSSLDWRRVRAALVAVLRKASDEGDALLTETDVLTRMETLELVQPCVISTDWLNGNQEHFIGEIERNGVMLDPAENIAVSCLQLTDLCKGEQRLARLLGARIAVTLPSLGEDWTQLLIATVEEGGTRINQNNPRHAAALKEQSEALERVTCRKLSVLVGGRNRQNDSLGSTAEVSEAAQRWRTLPGADWQSKGAACAKGERGGNDRGPSSSTRLDDMTDCVSALCLRVKISAAKSGRLSSMSAQCSR